MGYGLKMLQNKLQQCKPQQGHEIWCNKLQQTNCIKQYLKAKKEISLTRNKFTAEPHTTSSHMGSCKNADNENMEITD